MSSSFGRSHALVHDERVHGAFRPFDVRRGERVSCKLRPVAGEDLVGFVVWRISPFGLDLVDEGRVEIHLGQSVQVELTMGELTTTYQGSVVAVDVKEAKRSLFGVRLSTTPKAERLGDDVDQRGSTRWQCHRLFYPTGVASNRARFHDRVLFRVTDVSSTGMRLMTSLRNKDLHVGTEFDATVQLPSVGEVDVRLRVMHLNVKGHQEGDQQIVGTKIVSPNRKLLAQLGQYILQFGGDDKVQPSPKTLAREGFSMHSVSDVVEYDVVRSDEDYQKVLELRSFAYGKEATLGVTATPAQMADIYDTRSRILICRYRGQIVATLRLCFHGQDDKFEEEQHVTFPPEFPPRELVVEASRAATHPDFRGSDLFLNMLRYTMLVTIQSGRRWIFQTTYEKLVPVYEKIGFRRMGLHWQHPTYSTQTLHFLLADCQAVFEGRMGNPLLWNTLVPNIMHLVETNNNIHLSWFARKRLSLYQRLTPLYKLYERQKLKRKFRD